MQNLPSVDSSPGFSPLNSHASRQKGSRLFADAAGSINEDDKSDKSTTEKIISTFESEDDTTTIAVGKSKVSAVTFNLIKAIAGSSVLALPSGLAAMSDYRMTLVPALGLMTLLGGVSAYTFAMYGRLVHASQAKSLGE